MTGAAVGADSAGSTGRDYYGQEGALGQSKRI